MRGLLRLGWLLPGLLAACGDTAGPPGGIEYPQTRRDARVTLTHGEPVSDPYRWLERAGSTEVRRWLLAQHRLSEETIDGARSQHFANVIAMAGRELRGVPERGGDVYIYRRPGGQGGMPSLWLTRDPGLTGERLVVLSPAQAIRSALAGHALSPDGSWLAFALESENASADWFIRHTATGDDQPMRLAAAPGVGVAWTADSRHLLYASPPPGEGGQAPRQPGIWSHQLGSEPARDVLLYPSATVGGLALAPLVTEDGRYAVFLLEDPRRPGVNALHYQRLPRTPVRSRVSRLLDDWDAHYRFLGNTERTFYLMQLRPRRHGRVIAVDLDRPQPESWRAVVPEREWPLTGGALVGRRLVLGYATGSGSRLFIHDLAGRKLHEVELPGQGLASSFRGRYEDPELLFSYEDPFTPPLVLRHDMHTGRTTIPGRQDTHPGAVEGWTWSFTLADGAPVRGVLLAQSTPGGTPAPLLIVPQAGGTRGELLEWRAAESAWLAAGGLLLRFPLPAAGPDDLPAATELLRQVVDWLILEGYSLPGRIGVRARGFAGVAAALLVQQQPEAVGMLLLDDVPLDLLRHAALAGGALAEQLDEPEQFQRLLASSPYHQLQEGLCYPATWLAYPATGRRYPAWHSAKYVAALQHAQACPRPVLLRAPVEDGGAGWLAFASAMLELPPLNR
ncbi:MAG: hypothetical protein JJT85_12845 [Chromatiales bacterium]|nr:hypothetical protein [Chromatiales bacterium]